jgi:hypothetical protein
MATSSASPSLTACVIELEHSKPNQFAKEHCISKFEELQCAIEKLVDFESIQANGIHGIKEAFEKQELMYCFDMLNGPVYSELVKDFWMKATITTKKTYTKYIEKLIENNPELAGKIPQEMGVRPFLGVEIKSYVAGLIVSIRLEHIYEALRLTSLGVVLKSTPSPSDSVDHAVQLTLYGKQTPSKSNSDLTPFNKVIYKILHESIVPKLGGTYQISVYHKMFIYHVAKGNKVNTSKLIFGHLLEAINSGKPHVHHCRLLSHVFAQVGLLDAVKPVFPGFGSYMGDPQIINATTLRYL